MGILKTGLKLVGSVALGATGIASTVLRGAASAAGNDELADAIGRVQDGSFEKIRDMWTPEEKKDDAYYDAQAERSISRAESATRRGEQIRREYERSKNHNE